MNRAGIESRIHKVYLVDDDDAVRSALTLLLRTLDIDVEAYADPAVFLNTLSGRTPGCLILDIRMPTISGLKVQERLVSDGCRWPIIIISGHGDIKACRRAFRSGAVDFLSKPIDEQDLIDAVQKGFADLEATFTAAAILEESRSLLVTLTPREREVLDLITRGYSSRDIAAGLDVSPRTIETHRAHIAEKLGTSSLAELTRLVDTAQPVRSS